MKTLLVIALALSLALPYAALARDTGSIIIQNDPNKSVDSTKIIITDRDERGDTWVLDTQTGKSWWEINDQPQHRGQDSILGRSILEDDDDD